MGARTGKEYLEGLRDGREIWLGAERVTDVAEHPEFAGAARTLGGLYDLQHEDPDVCLMPNPDTGEPMNVSHLIPRSKEDLLRRHAGLERTARWSVGLLGRTPDYLNVTFAGFAGRADLWAMNGNDEGAANVVGFQKELARRDLALTHTLIHPTVDKSVPEVAQAGGGVALHKVADTEHGILVRGARVLATLAPFADEIAVYPGIPIPEDAPPYALCFSIPMNTPGLKVLCRDSYSVDSNRFDHPFSTRFDEQDAFVIFDDVEVPRHRVFIDGNTAVYNRVVGPGWAANAMQQTTIRAMVKLQFAYELAARLVEALAAGNPTIYAQLGEIWSYAELTRAALFAAEEGAYEWGNGAWFCDERPFRALRPTLPQWFPRVSEIIKLIGSHNLIATPTASQLADPELRPLIDRYLRGAGDTGAEERIRLYRMAWDFTGTALAGRTEQYERFYLASAARTFMLAHIAAQKEGMPSLVERVLREDDAWRW